MRLPCWTKNNYYDNPKTKTVIQLTNGDEKGYQYSFNAVLTKKFDFGFTGSFGYTYTMAKDMTANPGSSAASVWQNNVAVNSLNDPGVSGSSSNLVVISFLFQLSSSFLILLKVVDMFAF